MMLAWIAVGVPSGLGASGGWDLWPLAAFFYVLVLARRALGVGIGPSVLLAALATSLVSPVVVNVLGVSGALVACFAAWLVSARIRRRLPPDATRV